MGEGHIQKFIKSVQLHLVVWITLIGLILVGEYWLMESLLNLQTSIIVAVLALSWLVLAIIAGLLLGSHVTKPTKYIAEAILHISPSEHLVPPPNIAKLKFGRELAGTLTRQVYDFATVAQSHDTKKTQTPNSLFDQLPVAIIGLTEKDAISLANSKATDLTKSDQIVGQQLKDTLTFLTEDEITIESWLNTSRQKALKDFKKWQRVEVKNVDNQSLGYFDIAVSFNKHSSSGVEVIITLYDHSEAYSEEEDSISFVALAVHELRTPVTVMRGYIEAFKEELGASAPPQIVDDLQKMSVSAETLATFISNILNVARINHGQLSLKLQEDDWNKVLPQIIDSLRSRASVYGKQIELRMQPDLPKVAIDRMTISEVITNLIDNAIKYSPDNAPNITVVSQINKEGQIATTVQDQGVGIPSSVMEHLFSKFHRNHRNQAQIGGTGLGLFLSKAIVTAHSGSIWANSKESQGSTFGFTLVPFANLAKNLQNNNNENIVRSSHGWIKNHTMQRR